MINRILGTLIAADFLFQAGWGLVVPIFAIFVTRQIEHGNLAMVGFIAATYWVTKSTVQPFLAHFLDITKGERDDFRFLIIGMYVANLVPLGYVFSTQLWHLFLLEFIRGLAMAAVVPVWFGIFTRHIAKGWEAFSWSLESTALGFAAGFAAAFGGVVASGFGFQTLFVFMSAFGLAASTLLLAIQKQVYPKEAVSRALPAKEKLLH